MTRLYDHAGTAAHGWFQKNNALHFSAQAAPSAGTDSALPFLVCLIGLPSLQEAQLNSLIASGRALNAVLRYPVGCFTGRQSRS